MVQAAQSRLGWNLAFNPRADRESEVNPVLVVQVNNPTPIVLNGEKFVIPGAPGMTVLSGFVERL